MILVTGATLFIQFNALKDLPMVDCLPYKKGNSLLHEMKMPENAIPDKYDYKFIYKKDGKDQAFDVSALPDSTWEFVDRKQVLVEKGSNNIPRINDFALMNSEGINITDSLLRSTATYHLLFMKEVPANDNWMKDYNAYKQKLGQKVYVVTAQPEPVGLYLTKHQVHYDELLTCDGVAIKTAARANPTLYAMKGDIVLNKWGWGNFNKLP